MRNVCFVFAALALASACASSTPVRTPSGKPGLQVHCGSRVEDCYDEARRMCPAGYYQVDRKGQVVEVAETPSGPVAFPTGDHEVLVECKGP
jgi:hypothetical protein